MLAVFFASGFSALLYQMVWQRLLTFFGGADVRSVTIIVAAFMAGLGLGSLAGGHVADRLGPRGRVLGFAACELLVALFGFASVPLFYGLLYTRLGPLGLPVWATGALVFAALLWPTFFMGASLPLLARALTGAVEQAGRRVAALYGWNTFGAAVGALLAVWVLVRSAGFQATVEAAAALNLLCAAAAVALGPLYWRGASGSDPHTPGLEPGGAAPAGFGFRWWCALYALSGFIALSLEIVWFRFLGVLLKSNSFTFATLLSLYLTGLGLGALVAAPLARRSRSPARVFLALQSAIAPYAALSVALLVAGLGRWGGLERVWGHATGYDPVPVTAALRSLWQWAASPPAALAETRELARLLLDLYVYVPLFLILPPTLLMGASFPFLQQATQTDLGVLGRRVGWLQVANIAGSTLGAVVTGVLLLHWIGSSWTVRLLVVLSAAFPLLLARQRSARPWAAGAALLCLAAAAVVPSSQRLWARLHGTAADRVILDEDGSGVSVLRDESRSEGWRTTVFVSGLGQSGLPYGGYHTVLGALPVLVHPEPAEVAVIGLGSGDTAFAVGARPETRRIDCIEIVACQLPTLEVLARRNPYPALAALLSDPRIRHVAGDGRAFLMKGGRYDVIEADALRPGSAYAGNLYSSEYFGLLRRHLKPGGLAVSWSPTPRTRDTFVSVFPHVVALDETLLGSNEPIPFDRERVRARLRDGAVRAHFDRAGIDIERVFRGVLKRAPMVYGPEYDRTALTEINTDLFPRDEYLVGESLRPSAAR